MRQKKNNRVADAYSQLKSQILSNQLSPGMQVPEPELSLQLGMSRTPVREALIRLQAEGLVELVPRRGLRVLPIKASDSVRFTKSLPCLSRMQQARWHCANQMQKHSSHWWIRRRKW